MPRTIVKPRSAFRGFTLIEILVVIAVAAILVTIAVMSFNLIDNDRAVQKQVIKLSSLIDMASDEAQIQGRDYGRPEPSRRRPALRAGGAGLRGV